MNYNNRPNLLLESLSYFGRKASSNTWNVVEEKIKKRKIEKNDLFYEVFTKLKELTVKIDKNISISDNLLTKLFSNIEGFPFNTIGSTSVAFLIFYGTLETFNGDLDEIIKEMHKLSNTDIAYNIAQALDIADDYITTKSIDISGFIDGVLSLSIPDHSKIAILDTYRNYHRYVDEIAIYLRPVIDTLKEEDELVNDLLSTFNAEVSSLGCLEFFKQISQLKLANDVEYTMRPFIFGMDTNITSNLSSNNTTIYSGVLRRELLDMLSKQSSYIDDVYAGYNLLGDRTRFDIICHLKKNSAYAQELSKHLNLSRNTIHHHMSKLINYGLVTCTTDGNRVYYALNNEAFEDFITNQQRLLCDKK